MTLHAGRVETALASEAGAQERQGWCDDVAERLSPRRRPNHTGVAHEERIVAVRRTILEVVARGGFAVEGGRWEPKPLAHALWTIQDQGLERPFVAAPMGELAALCRWAKAPNILVGRPMPQAQAKRLRALSPLVTTVLSVGPIRRLLGCGGRPPVSEPEPQGGWRSMIWAETWNGRGDRVASRLETGEGYLATAAAAIANIEALAQSSIQGSFTPASAFGADHVLRIDNVRRFADDGPRAASGDPRLD